MPKMYSDEEKKQIIEKLKLEANVLMQEKGVKKTTVDELVKRAGIPKGTFYLFYPSKEMLLFDVSQDFHEQVDQYIANGFQKIIIDKNMTKNNLDFSDCVNEITDVILGAMEITYNSCLKVLLEPESMNLILSKIPDEVLEKHRKNDSDFGEGLFKELATKNGMSVETLVGSFMMIIFGGMYKREVGEQNWKESMRLLIKGIVIQLVSK
ncbi:MAG: TetR/AcrR family transcriptional regulator [Lachnospiraceae bacterium]|nr:TetR/AcrR family transcriptional regulator [Lachnospiraceae bacterium]